MHKEIVVPPSREQLPALKRNDLVIHTTAWASLKIIMGNERQKKEYILYDSIYRKF